MTLVLLLTFAVLLILDVPVAICMMLSSLAALVYIGIDPIMVGLETTRSLASFYAFLAVPFFILAGEIMSQGGLSERLIGFVKAFLGHRRSGLPFVTVVSSQMFGAVSGASAATCAAIGGMMIPELEKSYRNRLVHDPHDLERARQLADEPGRIRLGVFHRNEKNPRSGAWSGIARSTRSIPEPCREPSSASR